MNFTSGQSSSVLELRLKRRSVSLTADVVYYVRLRDILLSNADIVGCPASIGIFLPAVIFFIHIPHVLTVDYFL